MNRITLGALLVTTCLATATHAAPLPADHSRLVLPFDVNLAGATGTSAWGISPDGRVSVGNFLAADGVTVDAFFFKDGLFTDIAWPGAIWTEFDGVTDRGESAGYFVDAANNYHALHRSVGGSLAELHPPVGTQHLAKTINAHGVISGNSFNDAFTTCSPWLLQHGQYRMLSLPLPAELCVFSIAINDEGALLINYTDDYATQSGHFYAAVATRRLDPSYSDAHLKPVEIGGNDILAYGFNNHGDVAGGYRAPGSQLFHGFVKSGGELRSLNFAGEDTFPTSISDGGIVSGAHGGFSFGFIAVPLPRK